MKKRGEVKHVPGSVRKHRADGRKHGAHKVRAKLNRVGASGSSILHAADSEFVREERFIEKEARWLFGPQELHVTTFVISLVVIVFLLHSFSIIFYTVLTIGALLFAHFMKEHHRPHDVMTILGLFFLPLAFTLMAFRDWFSWLLAIVYTISVISAVIIYYYHKKAHSLLKIMWQVVYSKVIAITLAMIVLCILPFVFPDAFMSVFELIFIYVLPAVLVFFFVSKFLYLYFFDRRHIRHDAAKSFKFALIYALAFIVLCMCIYSLFAVGAYTSRTTVHSKGLTTLLVGVDNVERSMEILPGDAGSLRIVKDIGHFAESLRGDISLAKEAVDSREISFEDILSDYYLGLLVNDSFDQIRLGILSYELADAKSDAVESYGALENIDDLDAQLEFLKESVGSEFVPLSQDSAVQEMLAELNDPYASVSYFEMQGFFYWFEKEAGLTVLYDADSIFGRQMSIVLKHMEFMRQLTRLVLDIRVFIAKEAASSSMLESLYINRDADILPMSTAVRYSLMLDYLEASEKSGWADKSVFRVD